MDRMELFADLEREFTRPFGKVAAKLKNDRPEVPVHGIFFFGRSFGDDGDELFELAARLVAVGQANQVLINGSEGERFDGTKPGEAWAGKTVWAERLRRFWSPELFREALISRPAFHAKDEHEAFLDVAVERSWKSVALLTQPHQAIRFMAGQVRSCMDRGYPMRLYAIHPRAKWDEAVHGSQGTEELPRWIHAQAEALRLVPYWLKGDICSVAELLEYLERRSKIV